MKEVYFEEYEYKTKLFEHFFGDCISQYLNFMLTLMSSFDVLRIYNVKKKEKGK